MLDRSSLNLPNAITTLRLLLAAALFVVIDQGGPQLGIPAAILFGIAAGTDFLDGYIARKYKLVTVLGRILDPFADKIIVCGALIFLLERTKESGVTAWMVVLTVGRELFITVLRSFLEQRGQDFSAGWGGKWKMALQCAAIIVSLLSFSPLATIDHFALIRAILLWGSVALAIYSGVEYVGKAARLLRQG